MTAEILRLYRAMPQELCQAEANEAAACALTEARAQWSANRKAQSRANVGVYAPLARNTWRIRYLAGVAALVVLYGVFEWAMA